MARQRRTSPCRPPAEEARAAGAPPVARSRAARRRAAVLVGVHLLIAVHLAHWWSTGRTVSPLEPSEAMEFARESVVNAGLVFFALTALSTLVLGRFFCGWGCHLVALQDLCRALLLRAGIRPRPLRSRALALVPAGAFAYMFLLPVALRLWHGEELGGARVALTTDDFWRTFPPWWGALVTFAVCGFAAVYFLGAKGFCTYGCPYGALFGAADRLAPGRIRVTDACEGCGHCTLTCSSNVDVAREVATYGMVVDPGCMKCLDCVSVCPKDALYYGFGRPSLGAPRRRSPRTRAPALGTGEELLLAALFLGAFLALHGLYLVVPLLLALGAAGITAFLGLVGWRLARRASVRAAGVELKSDGRLTRAGGVAAAALSGGALLVVHSAAVQVEGWRCARRFEGLEPARAAYFSGRRAPLGPRERADAEAVLRHGGRALAVGLLEDPRRHREVAWAALLTGDGDGFERHMRRAVARARGTAVAWLELGNHRRALGDLEGAAASYREALERDRSRPWAFGMLADVLEALGRREEADAALADGAQRQGALAGLESASLDLLDLPRRAAIAGRLVDRGAPEQGIAVLEEGAALAPDDPAPRRVLALTHMLLGDLDAAERECRRSLELPDPAGEGARLLERIRAARSDPRDR